MVTRRRGLLGTVLGAPAEWRKKVGDLPGVLVTSVPSGPEGSL